MKDQHLLFQIIEYFLKNPSRKPTLSELRENLNIVGADGEFLGNLISTNYASSNPNHILYTPYWQELNTASLQLLPSAIITYSDYLEIKMARENSQNAMIQSRQANRLALTAFWVSLVVGVAQIVISLIKQ